MCVELGMGQEGEKARTRNAGIAHGQVDDAVGVPVRGDSPVDTNTYNLG